MGKADLGHNTDRRFDMPLKTNRIKFLPSGLPEAREFICKKCCYFVSIKIDASSITQNGCNVCLFSVVTYFVSSGDVIVRQNENYIAYTSSKYPAVRFAL